MLLIACANVANLLLVRAESRQQELAVRVAGMVAAFGLMRVLSTLLFDVSPVDPLTYGLVSLALIAATTLASYIPAARATAIDPIQALRAN